MFIKKLFEKLREAHQERKYQKEEEYFKRTSNKYYRPDDEDKPKFSDDYFKSSDDEATRKEREQREQEAREQVERRVKGEQPGSGQSGSYRSGGNDATEEQPDERRMKFSNGITIIDERDPSRVQRKIFAPNEGEYTEFEEC